MNHIKITLLIIILFITVDSYSQNYTFRIIDEFTGTPIKAVDIKFKKRTLNIQPDSTGRLTIKGFKIKTKDSILVNTSGYKQKSFCLKDTVWKINKIEYDFLPELLNENAFQMMQSVPFYPTLGEVSTIKFIYEIKTDKIYYINSGKYLVHHYFAKDVLGVTQSAIEFKNDNYTPNLNRKYLIGYLNYYKSSKIYALDFHLGNGLGCEDINFVYKKISKSYIGKRLFLFQTNNSQINCNVPQITDLELYKGQNFQALNPCSNFGYLKLVVKDSLKSTNLRKTDIVVTNSIPEDISVVAGIITTEFQTPLSHINVLSHNRNTPNMALKDAFSNPKIKSLVNKLVYLKVTLDSMELREANIVEAELFWKKGKPKAEIILKKDVNSSGIIDLKNADIKFIEQIGGKAANYSELLKINFSNYSNKIPIPEDAFAIPFHYYEQHIRRNRIDTMISSFFKDSTIYKSKKIREEKLTKIQKAIKTAPLDSTFLNLLNQHFQNKGNFEKYRFRSSTNAEDIRGFNGAGLYDSYTGILNNNEKSIEKAIKKVWASLWNLRAFDERLYFKIDQNSVAMGILVHRSFPSEVANGVVITQNLYNKYNPGMVINVQVGESSVVKPDEKYLPDQIIYYDYGPNIYIGHSSFPEMEKKTVLKDEELDELRYYCDNIRQHFIKIYGEKIIMDIEFKVDIINNKRKIYIKQARIY